MAADYSSLTTQLNSLSGTNDAKIAAINAMTVPVASPKAIVNVRDIVNAMAYADLLTLTTNQLLILNLMMSSATTIDASPGTDVRAAFQAMFAGKATTLANLTALVAVFDNATTPWWQAHGFSHPIDYGDVKVALNIPEISST